MDARLSLVAPARWKRWELLLWAGAFAVPLLDSSRAGSELELFRIDPQMHGEARSDR